jgi:hypothetical protein
MRPQHELQLILGGVRFMPVKASASTVLDAEFLELRARLLHAAAQLDRLDRAQGAVADDARMQGVHRAIQILAGAGPNRAEQIQLIFSRPYDPNWKQQFHFDRSSQ